MAIKDKGTEQMIKDTAKRIFFSEGKMHATTQDIADAAGINRTLVHYYFRSRDILLNQIFEEGMQATSLQLEEVFASGAPFKEKITSLIEVFMKEAITYPYRELFVITEMNSKAHNFQEDRQKKMEHFLNQIQQEMDGGKVKKMDPKQFVMNLFALMAYPLVSSSLNKNIFKLNDQEYHNLMLERKNIILETIYP